MTTVSTAGSASTRSKWVVVPARRIPAPEALQTLAVEVADPLDLRVRLVRQDA